MIFDFSCDIGHIQNDIPHQLWEAVSADGHANTFVTRFLHNTPSFYLNNFLRCYLFYLSPEFLNQTFSLIGLILFCVGLWRLITHHHWPVILLLLVAPLSPLFDFPTNGLVQTIILYGAILLVIFFGVVDLLLKLKRK